MFYNNPFITLSFIQAVIDADTESDEDTDSDEDIESLEGNEPVFVVNN